MNVFDFLEYDSSIIEFYLLYNEKFNKIMKNDRILMICVKILDFLVKNGSIIEKFRDVLSIVSIGMIGF